MRPSKEDRLSERIRERVANVVLFELSDPRMGFTTITRVKLAKDLSTCQVFYSIFGSATDRSKAQHALQDATGFVQREVAKVLKTRVTPRLTFHYDESIEGGLRIAGLLKQIEDERGEAPADEPAAPPDEAPHEDDAEDARGGGR